VSEESIRYNFEFGYKNLYEYVTEFDFVTLFDNGLASFEEPIIPQEILYVMKGKVYLKIKDYPEWVEPVMTKFQGSI
jgi:hypothetical protein